MKIKIQLMLKSFLDFILSIVALIVLTPLLLIVILLIKFTSKGPIFFNQDRLGKDGKVFKIHKFRTMILNAENQGDGLFVKSDKDIRITKIGKILRATSLDELPQLWNVIKGEMSLVGPRPPVPHHPYTYDNYTVYQRERFRMKPGITGLSQVLVRNSVSWDERIKVDLKYIENYSLLLDLKIIFITVKKIFISDSIYLEDKL